MRRIGWISALVLFSIPSVSCLAAETAPEQKKSIDRGIQWLLKAQNPDGSWGMDAKITADVAATAISGLALLAAGQTERDGPQPACTRAVKLAVDYLVRRSKKTKVHGDIAEGERTEVHTYVGQGAHTFFATLFLSQAYGMRSPEFSEDTLADIKRAIVNMSDTISFSQDSDGSWHKETFSSLQSTALAWMALRSTCSTGIPIKFATIPKTLSFIRQQYDASQKLYACKHTNGWGGGGNMLYDTASAVRILYGMGHAEDPETRAAVDRFLAKVAKGGEWSQNFLTSTGEDYPAAVYMTHALVQEGGERWNAWYAFLSGRLNQLQNTDGSWTATSCLRGRTFPTACALLCLQTPLRLLPIQDL